MLTYLIRHLQVAFATLGDMRRALMSTINTLLVIAITLLLPSLLYVAVKSAQGLSDNWQGRPQMSIFMQQELDDEVAQLIFEEIQLHPFVALAEFISPAQALDEFRVLSGQNGDDSQFDQELEFLGENPLPPSIVIMPSEQAATSEQLLVLQSQLSEIEGIDKIRLDLDWTDRFNAILNVFSRVAILLSALLSIALVLIVSNTIKLLIVNRRQEIEITKLVGGTDSFVRRPFLYYGSLLGIIGSLVTLALLLFAAYLVEDPLSRLAELYQSGSLIYDLKLVEMAAIVAIGGCLGWLAARWSVARHLRDINPS